MKSQNLLKKSYLRQRLYTYKLRYSIHETPCLVHDFTSQIETFVDFEIVC